MRGDPLTLELAVRPGGRVPLCRLLEARPVRREGSAFPVRDLGVGRGMLTKWRKQLHEQGVTAFPGAGKMPDQDLDGQQLRRDVRRVRQERDILKKALAIFSERRR